MGPLRATAAAMKFLARSWRSIAHRPGLASLALGAIAATGFQPLGLWPLSLAAMAVFAGLIAQSPSPGRAALLGWLFGIGHFTLGNSWIATAFTFQANMPALLGWFAVPLLALYLALYPALAALGARAIAGPRLGLPFALAFGGCWIVSEFLRATVFTGYAWNPLAMILLGPFDRPGLAILLPWFGTYALSGLAALIAAGLAILLSAKKWATLGSMVLVLAIGMYLPAGKAGEGALPFTMVQPDLRQEWVNDPAFFRTNFQRLAQLSHHTDPGQPRLLLWPESGMSDYLRSGYPQRYYDHTTAGGSPEFARARIGKTIGQGSLLLTGAVDLEFEHDRPVGVHNSITALGDDGTILGDYSKAHLVPYGEYLPLRWLLEPLGFNRFVPGTIDFIPGPGPRSVDFGPYGKAGMQVCYEIVFSGEVVDPDDRPDYLFNPSNDGWFGSFGPPQHMAQARMRAIEEGLPVLRSTTNGISAVIDARGVVRDYMPRNYSGRIDGFVPPAFEPTLFARLGNGLALIWAAILLGLAFTVHRRREPAEAGAPK